MVAHKFNAGYDKQLLELYDMTSYNLGVNGLDDIEKVLSFKDKYRELVTERIFFIIISVQECYISTAEDIEERVKRGTIVKISIEDILDIIKLYEVESIDWIDLFTTGRLTF
ncbi:hypothetical protein GGI19_000352 [Coemansia pectinata]|uniref:Uncharacterized protein n=1 Tax=Coemansia pectinata TaxID=1052879 RepID=A0A9W8H463_9FUNG|nr:hypothetical protein GGI19_000352 [Coemansia pectinata]